MPVKIGKKTYKDHDSAVAALKRQKPDIKNPDAYVASIERHIRKSRAKKGK